MDSDPSAPASTAQAGPILARVLPFRAIRYNTQNPAIMPGELIAPPGESASATSSRDLDRRPYHALALFPPAAGKSNPKELEPEERTRLSQTIRRFWEQGALTRDQSPALYLHRLVFRAEDGSKLTRHGFFALLAVGPLGSTRILPHEKTLPKRMTRQIQIFESLQAQVLPIFLLYSDPAGEVLSQLEHSIADQPPLMEFTDAADQHHRLHRVGGLEMPAWLDGHFGHKELIIADGHHRFDSLRELWRLRGADQAAALGLPIVPEAEAYVAVYLTPVQAPGFRVGAFHRVLRRASEDHETLWSRVDTRFHRIRVPLASENPAPALLEQLSGAGPYAFGVMLHGDSSWYLLYPRSEATYPALEALPPELRALDVSMLHQELMPCLQGQTRGEVEYEKDPVRALQEVLEGSAELAVFLNPIRPEQIWAVAQAGLTMPPKATYFFPKIAAGLVGIPLANAPSTR